MVMLLPIAYFMSAAMVLLVTLLLMKRVNSFWKILCQAAYLAFWFTHIELAFYILTSFDCVDYLGEKVLADDMTRQCFSTSPGPDGDHLRFILSFCVPFGFIWLIVVPAI